MRISDLPAPVTASKADWSVARECLSFTPANGSTRAESKCQSRVLKQFGRGYVLEYITEGIENPNPGFETDPRYLEERRRHKDIAGRLQAVHRLQYAYRPLRDILGPERYEHTQNMWAQQGRRYRWNVAFPITESYDIKGRPKAKLIFGREAFARLYTHPSRELRKLTDADRAAIADLKIEPREVVPGRWIAKEIDDEKANLNRNLELLAKQLPAIEGMSAERLQKIRMRDAGVVLDFLRSRATTLRCDRCGFDPAKHTDLRELNARSLFDVHHKYPLRYGTRETRPSDFSLLCPRCHRIEEIRLRLSQKDGDAQ